jgi:hypothetical protein
MGLARACRVRQHTPDRLVGDPSRIRQIIVT